MSRYDIRSRPARRPPVEGETKYQAQQRRAANNADIAGWNAFADTRCGECGLVRFHVSHEMEPENSPEGAAYHAGFAHHEFVEPVA
jgi:hypothetical protein